MRVWATHSPCRKQTARKGPACYSKGPSQCPVARRPMPLAWKETRARGRALQQHRGALHMHLKHPGAMPRAGEQPWLLGRPPAGLAGLHESKMAALGGCAYVCVVCESACVLEHMPPWPSPLKTCADVANALDSRAATGFSPNCTMSAHVAHHAGTRVAAVVVVEGRVCVPDCRQLRGRGVVTGWDRGVVARSPLVCSCRVVMVMLQLYIHMKGRSKKQHRGAPLPGVCVLWDGHARSWGQPGADCWLQVTRPQPLADYAAGHGSSAHAYSTVVPWLAAALGTVCVWPTQVVGASVAGGFLNTTSHMGWRGGGGARAPHLLTSSAIPDMQRLQGYLPYVCGHLCSGQPRQASMRLWDELGCEMCPAAAWVCQRDRQLGWLYCYAPRWRSVPSVGVG